MGESKDKLEIEERLKKIIKTICGIVDINFQDDLIEQLDSLKTVSLFTLIEKEFGIKFPTSQLLALDPLTIEALCNAVGECLKNQVRI